MLPRTLSAILLLAGALAQPDPVEVAKALLEAGVGQVVEVKGDLSDPALPTDVPTGMPVVMMHGMGDFANNPLGMVPLKKKLAETANAYVHSVEICSKPDKLSGCSGEDQSNGFLMSMDDQVDQFARVVRADSKLSGGFNAVGFSQGNTLIRGYIHRYNDPPVKTFVSLHGVMMGVAGLPHCPMTSGLGVICREVDRLTALGAYTSFVQNHLAQANYFRDPEKLSTYRKDTHFLPYINNEVQGKENATYTSNFESLTKLALVMAENDTMVHPKESEHFGYFKDGSDKELIAMQDAPWYTENWFGLKTLDTAKKLDFYSTPGDHLRFTEDFFVQMAQKYFVSAAATIVV